MKVFVSIFLVLMLFPSCEKFSDNPEIIRAPGNPNTNFDQHILEGYFVKSIAFDSEGNAWIGTFKQGLTQAELAEKVGTTKSYISKIENNVKEVRLSTLQKIVHLGLGGSLDLSIKL